MIGNYLKWETRSELSSFAKAVWFIVFTAEPCTQSLSLVVFLGEVLFEAKRVLFTLHYSAELRAWRRGRADWVGVQGVDQGW